MGLRLIRPARAVCTTISCRAFATVPPPPPQGGATTSGWDGNENREQLQAYPIHSTGVLAGTSDRQERIYWDAGAPPTPPDYSKGPSALDKASRLFFFTEIMRGMWVVLENYFRPPFTIM